MRKNNILEFTLALSVTICIVFAFSIYAGAIDIAAPTPNINQPNAFTIKELNIIPNYTVLEGQTLQMKVEDFDEFVVLSYVEWTSSNPDIISCTKNGEIKGLKEGKATIKVKAKVGNATDSITVYCARKLSNPQSTRIANPFAWTCQTPTFLHFQTFHFNIFPIWVTGKLQVKGIYGSYFYVEFERSEKQFRGFILQSWMPNNIASSEVFKQLSTYELDAYVGIDKDTYKVTTNYKGNIKWTVSDSNIINFDSRTGKVFCKAPGIATISATVDDTTLVCTVHSIYVWPQKWTAIAKNETCVYKAKGTTYQETTAKLLTEEKFTVSGDIDGWAYGVSESGAWGYVPISHISTKGTISQYRNLNWLWPVSSKNGQTKANYISSPYGKRDTSTGMHKGIDITTGTPGEIAGYDVVSAFEGNVAYISTSSDSGTGYCVAIRSKTTDPISGKYLVAIYMHLDQKPTVSRGQPISKGEKIGYVGNTGSTSTGYHLHFEANNRNVSIGDGGDIRNYYANLINPLFFFTTFRNNYIIGTKADKEGNDDKIIINSGSDAVSKYYGAYWYGDDK